MTLVVGTFERLLGPSDDEPPWYVNDHSFVRDRDGTWHVIGITHDEPMAPFDEIDLLHATAPTLSGPWRVHEPSLTADRSHGETHLWAPHLVAHDGRYWMFYCAGGASPETYRIHLAVSDDGWSWTRHEANPLVVDGYEARDPMVLAVDGGWLMYYTATDEPHGGAHVVAAVRSDDLVHWSDRCVVYRDPMVGTGGGPTESPFVVERDGRYLLFIGPDFGRLVESHRATGSYDRRYYRRTRVLTSDDPLHFDQASTVATIDAHAAEIVVDEHGDWWVSHCGWGEGGLYIAPLTWGDSDPARGEELR